MAVSDAEPPQAQAEEVEDEDNDEQQGGHHEDDPVAQPTVLPSPSDAEDAKGQQQDVDEGGPAGAHPGGRGEAANPYQEEGLDFIQEGDRTALAWGRQTGKVTLTGLYGLWLALTTPPPSSYCVSPSQRQSDLWICASSMSCSQSRCRC
ncbi:MAG: hypothetical protein V3U30_01485 [Thermoplasmata archaeon]